ncbi:TPA: hypothetical protein N0F65_006931, partial [Lagenidium giganteum]
TGTLDSKRRVFRGDADFSNSTLNVWWKRHRPRICGDRAMSTGSEGLMFNFAQFVAVALAAFLALATSEPALRSSSIGLNDFPFAHSFATKTAYWDQRPLSRPPLSDDVDPHDLTLLQLQQVNRHGSRYPTKGNIQTYINLVNALQKSYRSVLPAWLQYYKLPFALTDDGNLAPAGARELADFGARTRASVGNDIPLAFTQGQFVVSHTYKPRTKASAQGFISTFFSNPTQVTLTEMPKDYDPFQRFYDFCPRYTTSVTNNAAAQAELTAYASSPFMQRNADKLRKALNLPASATVTSTDVSSVYSLCAFDIALFDKLDNWCTLLDPEYITTAEFAEELDTFYNQGPGYKLNYEMASVLLRDIYKQMVAFIQGDSSIAGNFRFSHAETTLPLVTLLGYVDRTPLRADYTIDQIQNRNFRAGESAPFAANVDFRLFQHKVNGKYYVQVRVNERIDVIPGCGAVYCRHTMRLDRAQFKTLAVALAVHADQDMVSYRNAMGTKTPYWDQRQLAGYSAKEATRVHNQTARYQGKYELMQVQQVTRHGTRFPTKGNIKRINAVLKKINAAGVAANQDHLAWLTDYELPYNSKVIDGNLTDIGRAELKGLGERTRALLPPATFPTTYSSDKYAFTHTWRDRARDSAFGQRQRPVCRKPRGQCKSRYGMCTFHSSMLMRSHWWFILCVAIQDRLLRFFDDCTRYINTIDKNEAAHHEYNAFQSSETGARAVKLFTDKLGLPESTSFTFKDVEAAYSACTFDLALTNAPHRWCSLVDDELAQIMDYASDLEDFYIAGGGYALNYEMASPLLKDIAEKIEARVTGKSTIVGHFNFAHAETTLPLVTLLGYGSREPLTADVTAAKMESRGFRTSVLSPFAANIEFRLYRRIRGQAKSNQPQDQPKPARKCVKKGTTQPPEEPQLPECEEKVENKDKGWFVQVLVNERPTLLPGCNRVYCPYAKVKELWKPYIEDYDFEKQCAIKSAYWDQRQQAGYGANESTHVADQVAKMQNQLTLVQVQQVTRHGSRFPTKGNIARIETVLNKLQTTAAPTKAKDHLAWLSGYKLPYNVSVEGELSDTGSAELQRFGQRTRAWLPTTEFPTAYSNDKYAFSHTYKSRTKASAHGFVSGFFKDAANVDYNQSPKDKDVLLRFYDQCERYTKTVDKNETAQKEFKKFAKSDAGDRVVQRFTANLGLTDSANITFKDVDAAFSACAIDLAVYNSSTHWCSLIDNELAQVLVNERPSLLPGCDGQVFCPFAKAKALWKPYVEDYDFDQQCAM